jgi:ubiquinone/menaquinone biosynthesis C-methylase UbiE
VSQQHYRAADGRGVAGNYERYFVPAIGAPAANGLIAAAALGPGERVLDVACGTGVVARLASPIVGESGSVTGLDINADMLAVARSATPEGLEIDWREASAEAMPFPDESFDGVLCQMGLQLVADRQAALGEMLRVLVTGGRLILNVPGAAPDPFVILSEALAHHVDMDASRFVNQVFSLHDTADLERMIRSAGFRDVSVRTTEGSLRVPAPAEFLWQYVYSTPLARVAAQMDDERREALERDVVARWQEFVRDGGLTLQVRMLGATAGK